MKFETFSRLMVCKFVSRILLLCWVAIARDWTVYKRTFDPQVNSSLHFHIADCNYLLCVAEEEKIQSSTMVIQTEYKYFAWILENAFGINARRDCWNNLCKINSLSAKFIRQNKTQKSDSTLIWWQPHCSLEN